MKVKCTTVLLLTFALLLVSCASGVAGPSRAETSRPAASVPEYSGSAPVSVPEPESVPEPVKVRALFTDRGEQVGDTGELDAGTILEPVDYPLEDDYANTYEFLGWDADGDGVAEEFPYVLNENTVFDAMVKVTPIVYHYDIIVKGETVSSVDCGYGAPITYPQVGSSIEDNGDVFIFLGWKFNGVFDGMIRQNVVENLTIEAYFAETQILRLYYSGGLFVKYLAAGEKLPDLSEWSVSPQSGYKIAWYTDESFTQPSEYSAMIEGNLSLYGRQEPAEGVAFTRVADKKQLLNVFNSMLLARTTSIDLFMEYDYGSLDKMMDYLSDNAISIYGYRLNASSTDSNNVKLKVTYTPLATVKTGKVLYTQVASANAAAFNSERTNDFSDFAVKKLSSSYTVSNSDALYYVLEHGMRPVIASSATELKRLYSEMEDVLRRCVDDGMTDAEKVRAIYEYLILNTTYDGELLEKVKANADTDGNRSYCLEGVFEDRLAVCDGISKAFCCLCRMEGIECVRVLGTKAGKGAVSHAWNKVKLDGVWYIVDATSGGTIVGNEEVLTYKFFLITDKENEKSSIPEKGSYTDLTCTTDYNFHRRAGLEVSSVEEAAALLKAYIENAPAGKSSYEIKLAYKVTDDTAAVQAILDELNMTLNISFTGTDGVYCFIYTK